jgi:outer membrane lipoprotein-sorting protein
MSGYECKPDRAQPSRKGVSMYKMFVGLTLLCLAAPAALNSAPPNPVEILQVVDKYRNPFDRFEVDVTLKSFLNDKEDDTWSMKVYGRDGDKSLVEFVSPAIEKGKYLLMLRETMWIYLPNTSKPLRISPLQRLMGDASNGDVARGYYAMDYQAVISGEEVVEGQKALVLDLTANDGQISYNRIKLWVRASDYRPIQGEYYGTSGKLLKRVFYRTFTTINGKPVIQEMDIRDAVRTDRRTVMSLANMRAKEVPEKFFNKNYLGRF